jgi:hypothetical protein
MKIEELFEKSQTKEEARRIVGRWCEANERLKIDNFVFGMTGDVEEYKGNFIIYPNMLDNGILPVKVKKCKDLIVQADVKSFLNFPDSMRGFFYGNADNNIKSLSGLSIDIDGEFYASDFTNLSLSRIDKYIKSAKGIVISETNKGPVLSLLKIKNLISVKTFSLDKEIQQVIEILNHYLTTSKDILSCQDELIDNGLSEYAKL